MLIWRPPTAHEQVLVHLQVRAEALREDRPAPRDPRRTAVRGLDAVAALAPPGVRVPGGVRARNLRPAAWVGRAANLVVTDLGEFGRFVALVCWNFIK